MVKIIIACSLLTLLAATPSFANAKQISSIAAIVNDEVITSVDVDKELAQVQKETEKLPASEKTGLRSVAVNRLVDRKLVEQKIRELDIKVSDEDVRLAIEDVKKQNNLTQEALEKALATQGLTVEQYKVQLKEQLERMRLMSQEVRSKIQVGEREMHEYYEAHRADYGGSETFHARHIFFKLDPKGSAEDAAKTRKLADEVLAKARGGEDFVELAKKYSQDPAAAKDGGDLGTFKRSDMLAEIGNTVAAMKPGEVSSLVESPAGLHIIKLEQKSQEKGRPFEEVKDSIEEQLYKKKSDERFNQWVKDLRSAASIDIKQP
ncbi:peptidylprolyl isomerase [Geomonas sp. Red69]|uniref:Peptidylprolyl isomerase n=1 Tax=Geomonas diazotrophica TaxID=2843197 RepID=A0ABX8JGN4_9BACT|nr:MULTISPECIES: peptidylprolyl isomerase [Geomonas]MBU5635389.1 peptidylprolyl isomerase [Geomonas diazotrophica]QWV97555.1 peptidylprolyl isomerase [Geomonas nitrogeniifigens]QXE86696.1 peptidylprolyl isomerase [Geomonas nitrogeniifigens]